MLILKNNLWFILKGTNKLPRFSCAAHKMNIAVRAAIKSHPGFSRVLRNLSRFAANIKHTIDLMKIYLDKKCQVRCENATRWGSSFLMLAAFIRAFDKGAFDGEHKCPYTRETLEKYFQILLPIYQFNLHVQKTDSNISEVVPLLATLIESKLKRMDLTGTFKAFAVLMIKAIEKKFNFELNSDEYCVASLFDTKSLRLWTKRSFSIEYIQKALRSIVKVASEFLPKENTFDSQQNSNNDVGVDLQNPVYSQEDDSIDTYTQMPRSDSGELNNFNSTSTRTDLESEKVKFLQLIKEKDIGSHSTKSFWNHYKAQLPLLSCVARQLLNIPSSSASIERFFSICGVICTQRRGNMSADMIITRSMLKVNLNLLTEHSSK